MWKTSKWTTFITTAPLLAVGIWLLYQGFTTSPDALTDDGYSLQNFFYLMGAGFLIFPIITTIGISLYYKKINDRETYLTQNGIKGEAEILYMEQTGTYINELPQVKFLLQLTLPDRSPYKIEHKEVVNFLSLSSLRIGAKLPVFVDPNNSKNILLNYQ